MATIREDRLLEDPETDSWSLVPHVLSRLATAVNEAADHYRGARAEKGVAVLGARESGHQVSVICGLDSDTRKLAVRVIVSDSLPAKVSIPAFPVAMLLTTWLVARGAEGADGLVLGTFLGFLAGIVASFATFSLVHAIRSRSERAAIAARAVSKKIVAVVDESVAGLGLTVTKGTARINGLDTESSMASASEVGDEALRVGDQVAWTQLMSRAISAIPH